MILPIHEEYLMEKLDLELELSDICLNMSIVGNLYSIDESQNIISRFIDFLKTTISKLINILRGKLKSGTRKLKDVANSTYQSISKTQTQSKKENPQYVEFDIEDGSYTMIGQNYMNLILNSFLLSKNNMYDKMEQYLDYFRDVDANQYHIQNEVRQFCVNFDMNGFNFVYPKLAIEDYIETEDELKEYIRTDIEDNIDTYKISNGKMSMKDYDTMKDSVKIFDNALNTILKEIDIAQKNLSKFKNTLDKLEFVSTENIFEIFRYFGNLIVLITHSNITACEIINREIEIRLQSVNNLISHIKKS